MKDQCHACGERIAESAKVCSQCNSSQNRFLYWVNSFSSLGSLVVSLLALLVSFAALYFSTVKEPASPRLIVQVDRFNQDGFSFFVTNLGELPTLIRDFDLRISLQQKGSTHSVQAGFTIPPAQIAPAGSQAFSVNYASFVPRYTSWTASDNTEGPFSLNFLYAASSLGANLHCEVDVYFTSRQYFPNNIDGAQGSVNGTCSEAMKWFAEKIGPLKLDVEGAN